MKHSNKKEYASFLLERLHREIERPLTVMEVCGTHTVAIARSGLRDLLPDKMRLLSGPGCPVCVTDDLDLDLVIALSREKDVILATFGDMMRVPGTESSLLQEKSRGADVRIVYSPADALRLAAENPSSQVVFLGVGFETTVPVVAAALEQAIEMGLENFSVYSLHKLVPPVMRVLLEDPEVKIDAFLNPGHVCTILGTGPFSFISEQYGKPCVVAGFDATDILEALLLIVRQYREGRPSVEIQYRRAVRPEGNPVAVDYIEKYFQPVGARWRGIGEIPESGLELREEYARYNARLRFPVTARLRKRKKRCACGEVLKGLKLPYECPLFRKVCTPARPVGPCMVSTEGSCAAYYRYGKKKAGACP
ncbi:hypD hydrogenase expression/formation protein HypD [Thermacetogenium phaeum DSM 12270]|uniref:HypD hydrogenase expression/formation protein HypD n=1 Tax=Thermacetogenium phaeum (strain ATCC BAA-254 / DSM 26808 / PB) TaxID=1089553 RepID=K4LGQ3_THEPS|nr:hydrogenase formation protein HypD [Thermacetogenium phaeum]AFV11150.1 hypD hydrogenase expression/formation protein HypD [Thermacetogenium phaeum DSM 12270]